MSNVLATVLPVFGLIALGFAVARAGVLPESTGKGLGDFVFTIAMPALLFRTMITVPAPAAEPFAMLASYFGANLVVWVLATLATRYWLARPADDAASIAMAVGFGNTVMLGLPLGLAHFGEAAAAPLALVIALHAPLLWTAATLQQEACARNGRHADSPQWRAIALDLARNPVILGVVAGSLWRFTGLGLAPVVDKTIGLIGQAGIPGALFALGMSLVRFQIRGQVATLQLILVLKLLVMPAICAVIAFGVFHLPPIEGGAMVLLAACPTGANAYLFAARYDRAVGSVSASVAVGTALSAITITVLLVLLDAR